ncbi:glycosyltransferase family 2 protein [Butyrivibrio sp. VCB2006]|uniref:glycosyltransferase family 2 protein n=1 Tax=Butyrivibrio sp. VCB2006 TaxID=1280679 RepID=UPI000413BF2D|nr:glycosyltransferase family 2 protein [Butyrivibrio sp. VCB2006]
MEKGLISIIVPAHNVEKYIDKSLRSLTNQTYRNLQIIVIDDNSPDRAGEIADEWAGRDSRITVVHNEKNMGHSTVRNVGLDLAKGEYIGFTDPDDYVHPQMFERLLELLKENDADISLCLEQTFEDGEEEPELVYEPGKDIHIESHAEYIEHFMDSFTGPIGWSWNKLYKAEVLKSIRYRNYKLEDIIFHAEAAKGIKKAVWTDDRLYAYRIRTDSITGAGKTDITIPASESFWATYEMLKSDEKDYADRFLIFTLGKIANIYAQSKRRYGRDSANKMHEYYSVKYRENIEAIKCAPIKDRFKLFLARYFGAVYCLMAHG